MATHPPTRDTSSKAFWHFDLQSPGMNVSPMDQKLFNGAPWHHIVREGFQNALDAFVRAADGSRGKVSVSIRLRRILRSQLAKLGLEEIIERAAASGYDVSGVGDEIYVFEFSDNGTGLTVADYHLFARRLGESGKGGSSGGRHGCGRTVLLHASHAHVMFALSVHDGDAPTYFIGMAVHRLHEYQGNKYQFCGVLVSDDADDGGTLPSVQGDEAFRLAHLLGSERKPGEHGLSVFVPCFAEQVSLHHIASQVVQSQFFPILTDQLEVTIDTGGEHMKLDAETFVEQVSCICQHDGRFARSNVIGDMSAIARATRAIVASSGAVELADAEFETAPEEVMAGLRARFESGEPVVVSVPLAATHSRDGIVEGRIRICILKDDSLKKRHSVYIRDAISYRDPNARGEPFVILTMAADDPISAMLGDAETAAHDRWEEKVARDNGWESPAPVLSAFRSAGKRLLQELQQSSCEDDLSILADIFPMPAEYRTVRPAAVADSEESDEKAEESQSFNPKEPEDMRDGLLYFRGSMEASSGLPVIHVSLSPRGRRFVEAKGRLPLLRIATGYAALDRHGGGFKGWAPTDYDLSDFDVDFEDAEGARCEGNSILIEGAGPNLNVALRGPLDTRRDVTLKVIGTE